MKFRPLFPKSFIGRILSIVVIMVLVGCTALSERFLEPPLDEEEQRIRVAIKIHPTHWLGYLRLSLYYQQQKRWNKALAILEEGRSVSPDSIQILQALGRMYQILGYRTKVLELYAELIPKYPNNPIFYLERGQFLWKIGRVPLAIEDLRKALEITPNSFEALFLLGMIYSKQGQREQALSLLIKAASINENQPEVWKNISILWKSLGEELKARSAIKKAIALAPQQYFYLQYYISLLEHAAKKEDVSAELEKTLRMMLKLFPRDPKVHVHYGNLALSQKKFDLAEKHLKEALKYKRDYPWPLFYLGIVYMHRQQWELSIQSFKEGLKYDPDNIWARKQLGRVFELQGKNVAAIEVYQQLLNEDLNEVDIYQRLAQLYWTELRFDDVEQTLIQGLDNFPGNSELALELARLYESQQRYQDAKEAYFIVFEQNPSNTQLLGHLGNLEKQMGNTRQSEAYFKQALSLSPDFDWARIQLIRLQLEDAQNNQAENELLSFLEHNPESEWGHAQLSLLKLRQKEYGEAEKIAKRALKYHKDSSWLYEILALSYEGQENWDLALSTLQKASEARPHNLLLLNHLGLVLGQLGKKAEALEAITQVMFEADLALWGWYQYLLLQSDEVQRQWFGNSFMSIRPVLQDLIAQRPEKAWERIESFYSDDTAKLMLENLYYLLQGKEEQVVNHLEFINPENLPPWIVFQAGYIYELQQNLYLAKTYYLAVLKKLPGHPWTHARLGVLYEREKQLEKSTYHYARFVEKYPQAIWGLFRMAVNKGFQGDEAGSIKLYQKILQQRPDHVSSLNNLAWLYLTTRETHHRNVSEALVLARQAVKLQPTEEHLDTLAEAYFQSGNIPKAIETIKLAIMKVNMHSGKFNYFMKQYERFRKGNTLSQPPSLSISESPAS